MRGPLNWGPLKIPASIFSVEPGRSLEACCIPARVRPLLWSSMSGGNPTRESDHFLPIGVKLIQCLTWNF